MNGPSEQTSAADRVAGWVVALLTLVIVLAVVALRFIDRPVAIPAWATRLPALNAILNSSCTVLLLLAYAAIRTGRRRLHQTLNVTAFALSAVFLVSYVLFHSVAPETHYPAGPWRPLYLGILVSHILLAMVVLPAVLVTFWFAFRGTMSRHRALARWTLPVWLYVTVTGVVVYLMISPHYPF